MDFLISIASKFCSLLCYLPLIAMGLIGLCLLVVFHEFGHFIFAKIFNIYVPSFSIGFGPKLIEKKIGETNFAISAILLGGYVEIAGSPEIGQGEQLHAKRNDERSFNQKPYWQKMCVMSGGILFNILFTYIAMTILLYVGSPCIGTWCNKKAPIIGTVIPGKAAEKAGLKAGDKITAIDNKKVLTIEEFTSNLKKYSEKEISITVARDNKETNYNLTPDSQKNGKSTTPMIGVLWQTKPVTFSKAIKEGWKATWSMIIEIASAIKGLTKSRENLGGPLILITSLTQFAGQGLKTFLFILAFISVNLAVFNVIPLPIFDGGQALFYTIEAIIGKPLSEATREKIHYYTWILVIILVIFLTINDLQKIFTTFFSK